MNSSGHRENRIFYYDIIRAFAILCIISCHVFAEYVTKTAIFNTKFWYYSLFLNSLRDIGVPLFVILSGSLLLDKYETLKTFAKKRITRVLVPYLFWGIIFILAFAFIFNNDIYYLVFNVFSLTPEGIANFFWFVPMIFITYVVIFIINTLNHYNKNTLKIALIISLIALILMNINVLHYQRPLIYLYYSIFAVFGYFLVNVDFSKNRFVDISPEKLFIIFMVLSLLFYILEVYLNSRTCISLNKFKTRPQFDFLNVLTTISIFLFFRYFSECGGKINEFYTRIKDNTVGKVIFSISICSYGIYLTHILIRELLLKFVLAPVKAFMGISIFSTLTLILTAICSWLLILALSRIPVLDKLSGSG